MHMLRMLFMAALVILPASSLVAQDPKKAEENSWISLNGTVTATDDSGFELDYGSGVVRIQMRDWRWYKADRPIQAGDDVQVNGIVEDDQGEKQNIVAESVYAKDLNTYFFTQGKRGLFQPAIQQDRVFQLKGTITSTEDRQFTMNLGSRRVIIDTSELSDNPLDDKGYQQLKVGDTVQVTGELSEGNAPLDNNKITANVVTTLLAE